MSISVVPYLDYDIVKQQLQKARTTEYQETLQEFSKILSTTQNALSNYKASKYGNVSSTNNTYANSKPATTATVASSSNGKVASFKYPSNYEAYFSEAAKTYNVNENLLKAIAKAESDFNANATSSAGAMGVMQLMPATAKSLGVSNPYNPRENIMGGAKYIAGLLEKYNGNTSLALAAYNAGSGNVKKYGGIPPFKETQNYVKKILSYLGDDMKNQTNTATTQTLQSTEYNYAVKQEEINRVNEELNDVLNNTLQKMNVTKESLDSMIKLLKEYRKDYPTI
ncbi:Transglycosylase SLT domain-containing protein [Lachnospiraceae bacterium C7]|nr:Transglycosylase SLT domain-containing protein [Lachnospiraceae bacterium C7]